MKEVRKLPGLPVRKRDGHKGDYGRVLVLAGSRGMAGAAALAGDAALRAGAGLVMIGTPESVYPIVAAQVTCCTTGPLPETAAGTLSNRAAAEVLALAEEFDTVAIGPGLGQDASTDRFVHRLVASLRQPMVIDADALNALAKKVDALDRAAGPRVLTPHPGEMTRLAGGAKVTNTQKDRLAAAESFARKHGVVLLLKGHRTIVTDAVRVYVNRTGNPGMATGGTGDVLSGVIAGLLAQGLDPFAAAQLGAYVHGLAGDLAAKRLGEVSLMASDLLDVLATAFCKLPARPSTRKTR